MMPAGRIAIEANRVDVVPFVRPAAGSWSTHAAPVVTLVERTHAVELSDDVGPAPVPGAQWHPRRVDEALVLDAPGVGSEALDATVVAHGEVVAAGAGERLDGADLLDLTVGRQRGEGLDVVRAEVLEQRGVAEQQAHRRLRAHGGAGLHGERRDARDVAGADPAVMTVGDDVALAPELQGEPTRAPPRPHGGLAWTQRLDGDGHARREARARR